MARETSAPHVAGRETQRREAPRGTLGRPAAKGRVRGRVPGYDVIRGASIVSMVGFHLCYDLAYLGGADLPWFRPPLQDVWRSSISWTLLVLAGVMCAYSRNNARRAGRYLLLAAAIFAVTTVVAVDVPISYGIIYCMGASTLAAWVLGKAGALEVGPRTAVALAAILTALFVLCLGVPGGTFGLGPLGGPSLAVPRAPYDSGLLSWLGFPGPRFSSGDYYPPLPYALLFLSGTYLGRLTRLKGTPAWARRLACAPLEWVGRHPLAIYVAHQPLLLLVTGLL